jgi:hypothetical protein
MTPTEQKDFLDGPALAPPQGVKPNFHIPPDMNVSILTIIVVCAVVSTLSVTIRVYARVFCLRIIRVEDCECLRPTTPLLMVQMLINNLFKTLES